MQRGGFCDVHVLVLCERCWRFQRLTTDARAHTALIITPVCRLPMLSTATSPSGATENARPENAGLENDGPC